MNTVSPHLLADRGDSKLTRVPSSNATVVTALTYTFLAEKDLLTF